ARAGHGPAAAILPHHAASRPFSRLPPRPRYSHRFHAFSGSLRGNAGRDDAFGYIRTPLDRSQRGRAGGDPNDAPRRCVRGGSECEGEADFLGATGAAWIDPTAEGRTAQLLLRGDLPGIPP